MDPKLLADHEATALAHTQAKAEVKRLGVELHKARSVETATRIAFQKAQKALTASK